MMLIAMLCVPMVVLYAVVWKLARKLDPPFVRMELASKQEHASNVLNEWKTRGLVSTALAVAVLDVFLAGSYVVGIVAVLVGLFAQHTAEAIAGINVMAIAAIIVAGLGNFIGDIFLFIMIARGRTYEFLVTVTRTFGRFRYTTMALTVVYFVFRGEIYFYDELRGMIGLQDRKTIGSLAAVTLILSFFVLRLLTRFSAHHRPLLSLLLAPDRVSAQGVLDRWGTKGRHDAKVILLLEVVLAVLYGVTLATVCHQDLCNIENYEWIAESFAWVAIAAASFHVAQNFGGLVALKRGEMGWWVHWTRRVGRVRIGLAWSLGLYFVALLVLGEWHILRHATEKWITPRSSPAPLSPAAPGPSSSRGSSG